MSSRVFVALCLTALVAAHCSIWHPSTFDSDRANGNSDANSQPLQDYPFDKWWWHGNLAYPPAAGAVFQLPANGVATVDISSNKAFTTMGYRGYNQENTPNPWTGNAWSNIHAVNRQDVAGCAFAIAYKSNPQDVKPSDFVVFSVVHDCIARQRQPFSIPNLPACPNGKCMCAWFWIHKSIGGSDQMYMTPFVCNVANASSTAQAVDVRRAQPPRKCYDPTTCTQGPRNPMYWKNEGSQNMPEGGHYAPTYSILYGFAEGAQKDIFVNTNPNNYTARAAPAEKKCTDAKINPKGYGSRILSSNAQTYLVDGGASIVSPNCKFSVYVEYGTGSIMVRDNTDGSVPLFYGVARNQRPYTLKIDNNGNFVSTNGTGQVIWQAPMIAGSFMARGPFRVDLNNLGQLVVTDATQHNRWESNFFDNRENNFSSLTADPAVWKK